MRWRLHAKGYTTGQAWWRETAWVYGVALLGFALYAALAAVIRFLGVPAEIHWWVLHGLAWGFFVVAHLPDVIAPDGLEVLPGEMKASGGFRCGNLLFALVIAAVNISAACLSPELLVLAEFRFSSISPWLLNLALQGALILFGTVVHGVINLAACLAYRLAFLRGVTAAAPASGAQLPAAFEPEGSPFPEPLPATTSHPSVESATAVTALSAPLRVVPPAPRVGGASSVGQVRAKAKADDESGSERPTAFRWLGRHGAAEPIRQLVDYLRAIPSEEVRPTLRMLSAMAVGDVGRLGTPALLDFYQEHLFHADGSLNAPVACRCVKALPQAQGFYPPTELGRTVYRPLARKLHKALRGVEIPALPAWLPDQPPAVRRCANLMLSAPQDEPVLVACVCSRNIHRSRTMQKILDHLIRRNGLGHVVTTCSGGADLDPQSPWDLTDSALSRVLTKQNATLARAGIREHDRPPRDLSEAELRSATVLLVSDADVERKTRARLRSLAADLTPSSDPVILFPALDPRRFRHASDLPDPYRGQTSVRESTRSILAVMMERVLPLLLVRAAKLEPSGSWRLRRMDPPPSPAERMGVAAYRAALVNLGKGLRQPRNTGAPQRLLKLIWASAHRDPTVLLSHGLPDALLERARDCAEFDDATLWNSLRNLRFLEDLIPKNRGEDYGKIVRALKKLGASIPAASLR